MLKKQSVTLAAALVVTLFASGCDKKSTPTSDDTTLSLPTSNASGQPLPTFSTVAGEIGGTVAAIQFDFTTLPGIPAVSYSMGFANFGAGIDAGLVRVNSDTLSKMTTGTMSYYNTFLSTTPKSLTTTFFNGSTHTWNVAGAGTVPAITNFAVTSPSSFTVTAPAAGATVVKTSGLTVSWSGTATTADSMLVLVYGSGGYALKQGVTGSSVNFTSTDLGSISGAATIQVVKYRYATKTVNSKVYIAVAEIVKMVTLTIN